MRLVATLKRVYRNWIIRQGTKISCTIAIRKAEIALTITLTFRLIYLPISKTLQHFRSFSHKRESYFPEITPVKIYFYTNSF